MLPLPEQVGDVQPPDLLPVLVHDHPEVLAHRQDEDPPRIVLGGAAEHLRVSGRLGVNHHRDLIVRRGEGAAQHPLRLRRPEDPPHHPRHAAAHGAPPVKGFDDLPHRDQDVVHGIPLDGLDEARPNELAAARVHQRGLHRVLPDLHAQRDLARRVVPLRKAPVRLRGPAGRRRRRRRRAARRSPQRSSRYQSGLDSDRHAAGSPAMEPHLRAPRVPSTGRGRPGRGGPAS